MHYFLIVACIIIYLFNYFRAICNWMHIDWIFLLSPKGKEQMKCLKIVHGFTERVRKNIIYILYLSIIYFEKLK